MRSKVRVLLRPHMPQNKKIGIFDSGFGGLDILKDIVKVNPEYEYIYLGDTARTPYGNRSKETIYKFSTEAIDFLFNESSELIIIACNTASCEALRKVQQEYLPNKHPNRRVLGVIVPTTEVAAQFSQNNKIGVMATESTVRSQAFIRELKKQNPNIRIFQQACPLLVPIIETGEENSELLDIVLQKYLKPLIDKNIDTLILGCTHYGLIQNKIKEIIKKNISIISEGSIVAEKLKDYLKRHPEIEKKLIKKSNIRFYTTDIPDKFNKLGSSFFGSRVKAIKINLQ